MSAEPEAVTGPTEFTTADPEEAHAFLRTAYVDNSMRITGSTEGFRMRNSNHDLGNFGFSSLSHTMAVEHVAQPLGYVLVGRLLVGRFTRESAGQTLHAKRNDVFLIASPDRPYKASWDIMRLQLVRIDLPTVTEVAGAPRPIEFTGLEPLSAAHGRYLKRTLSYISTSLLANPEALNSPLAVTSTARLLAAAVLATFENNAPARPVADRAETSPAALRRAIEFIDSSAHRDIGLADIAAAARTQPRSLHAVFRYQLGISPAEYLRRVRLESAHRDLVAADPSRGDTVALVSARWGFADPASFAADYRDTFGVAPDTTLQS